MCRKWCMRIVLQLIQNYVHLCIPCSRINDNVLIWCFLCIMEPMWTTKNSTSCSPRQYTLPVVAPSPKVTTACTATVAAALLCFPKGNTFYTLGWLSAFEYLGFRRISWKLEIGSANESKDERHRHLCMQAFMQDDDRRRACINLIC